MKTKKANFVFITFILIFSIVFPVYAIDENIEDTIDYSDIIEVASNTSEIPTINSRTAIVYDRISKQVLYGKNEYNKVKMASTTKIMTAIVIIENDDLTQTVEISKKAAGTGGSRLGLKAGDKITINDLLHGLMLCSGNDAAVALAECTAGSIQEFAELMNNKALELGLTNSHFESPHGLDSDGHYTTAYELAKLSDYALQNKTFAQIVGTKSYTVTINGSPKNISNTNELLGNLNGVYGIKTGFTNGANRCLVTACKRNNMDIICVVLGADTKNFRTKDSIKLIEYSFKNFEYVNIEDLMNKKFEEWKSENMNSFIIDKASNSYLDISISKLETPIIPVKKENINKIDFSIDITTTLSAPISQGHIIGNITAYSDSLSLASADVVVNNSISKKNSFDYLYLFFKDYCNILYDNI